MQAYHREPYGMLCYNRRTSPPQNSVASAGHFAHFASDKQIYLLRACDGEPKLPEGKRVEGGSRRASPARCAKNRGPGKGRCLMLFA